MNKSLAIEFQVVINETKTLTPSRMVAIKKKKKNPESPSPGKTEILVHIVGV